MDEVAPLAAQSAGDHIHVTRVLQAARSAAFAVALAALVGTTSGQVKPRVKPLTLTLTPMDYIEIRQLVNRYAFALDTGSNNGYDYADLFAADGEFMRPYAKGREQLAALARGPRLEIGRAHV